MEGAIGDTEDSMEDTGMAIEEGTITVPGQDTGQDITPEGTIPAAMFTITEIQALKIQGTRRGRTISIIKHDLLIRRIICMLAKEAMFIREITRLVIIKTNQMLSDQVNSRVQDRVRVSNQVRDQVSNRVHDPVNSLPRVNGPALLKINN